MAPLRIGIAGLGTIGFAVAQHLVSARPSLILTGVAARDADRATTKLASRGLSVPILSFDDLAKASDIVIECLPPGLLRQVAEPVFANGRDLVVLSTSGFLDDWSLVGEAEEAGSRIIIPSGAIVGLDAVRAAKRAGISSAVVRTSKGPEGFRGLAYLAANDISVENLAEPLCLFAGSVRDGAKAFPSSVNVAVAVSLAGIGPDATQIEIWADPAISRNTHQVSIVSEAANLMLTIENKPAPDNPRTSSLVAHSVVAALLNRTNYLQFS
jgi:aspartate dehydrogenase